MRLARPVLEKERVRCYAAEILIILAVVCGDVGVCRMVLGKCGTCVCVECFAACAGVYVWVKSAWSSYCARKGIVIHMYFITSLYYIPSSSSHDNIQ